MCVCVCCLQMWRGRKRVTELEKSSPALHKCFNMCVCVCVTFLESVGRKVIHDCVRGSRASIYISSKCRTSQQQRGSSSTLQHLPNLTQRRCDVSIKSNFLTNETLSLSLLSLKRQQKFSELLWKHYNPRNTKKKTNGIVKNNKDINPIFHYQHTLCITVYNK